MERALHAARQQFQAIFDHAPLCISLVDLEGTIVDINFAACELLGRTRQELIGTSASETVHPDDIEQLIETTTRQLSGSDLAAEFRLLRADGTPVWVLSSAAIVDPGGDAEPYVVTIQTDITERRLLEERLAHEATRDPLTGLLNRGAFMTQLELALARTGVPTALLFLDLDGFKHVNDTLGHEAGDAVLATLARRIQDVVRDDDIVARFGGDEFVVLCRDATEREALAVAERVRATTDRPVVVRGAAATVGASVGVALSNAEEVSARLLRRADTAAYSAKRAGRGRVVLAASANAA
jgi:diguanylate cyclase (GGDEF)-like protein/PAS domain S-box-containing protein